VEVEEVKGPVDVWVWMEVPVEVWVRMFAREQMRKKRRRRKMVGFLGFLGSLGFPTRLRVW
jgi:hypothetical protein